MFLELVYLFETLWNKHKLETILFMITRLVLIVFSCYKYMFNNVTTKKLLFLFLLRITIYVYSSRV